MHTGTKEGLILCDGTYCVYQDPDCDGILNDGDNSGTAGDNPCTSWEIANCDDNCPNHPNGPYGGTCIYGGEPCMSDNECGTDGFCSMHQEDFGSDGVGDACGGSVSGIITCENCSGGNPIIAFALSEELEPDFSNLDRSRHHHSWRTMLGKKHAHSASSCQRDHSSCLRHLLDRIRRSSLHANQTN